MGTPLRILLIDDDPDDRFLVQRRLRPEFPDLLVTEISESEDLARALDGAMPDLVITDYQLHWTDGLAVLRAVKDRWPDAPVLMVTGTGSELIAVEAMKARLDDYILKAPHHLIRLPAAARAALDRAAQQFLIALAQLPAVRNLGAGTCNPVFADILRQFPLYTNLAAVKPNGDILCAAVPLRTPVTIADRPYLQETLRSLDFTVSGYSVGRVTGKANIRLGYPALNATGVVRARELRSLVARTLEETHRL